MLKGGKQPMVFQYENQEYAICYNGQLYNTEDLRKELLEIGYTFEGYSDTEVVLKGFVEFGYELPKKLNGVYSFAIWNQKKQELYFARDPFGIKPLFYSIVDGTILFASEIKAILKHPSVETVVDKQGISELIGLGPCHTPGLTVFKNIYEIKPGYYAVYKSSGFYEIQYWNLISKRYTDSFSETCEKIRFLLQDAIERQLVSDVPLCTFLSGGLDSSIITTYVSRYYQKKNLPTLHTYSVDYIDNDKNFVKSDFEPNSDKDYITLMAEKLQTKHHTILIDTPELAESLEEAMIARDMPGMADVDSSLLLFCKKVKESGMTVAISGECADEIFAGYPWFFREDALRSNTFPWSIALTERQQLLNPALAEKINLKEYIDYRYRESLAQVPTLDYDSKETAEKRKITYLTQTWFMQTLLERSDRMALANGLDIRVPFCDYRIVEYLWNIPWEVKSLNSREKGLLRYVVKDILPEEIVSRKKSPYPKTHNPNYLAKVKEMLSTILQNPNAPIHQLLNDNYMKEILETDGKAFSRPWFGQLMTGPQLMAYLCQVNMWLERYEPRIEL